MNRRRALVWFGSALTGGIAGCSGGADGTNETTTGRRTTERQTATQTDSTTAATTATPTQTATATPTQPSSEPTHGLDEPFTVGQGTSAVGFTFRRFFRAQELGPTRTETARDTFLIVVLTVENPQSETIIVPAPNMNLRASGVIRNVDEEASKAAGSDTRLEVKSISNATITPGNSVTGVIVYDAPTGHDYRIVIKPTDPDAGQTHVVPVGNVAELDPLPTRY